MKQAHSTIRRLSLLTVVFVQMFCYPAAIFAQEVPTGETSDPETSVQTTEQQPISESETPPVIEEQQSVQQQIVAPTGASNTGPQSPTGAAAASMGYNESTGVWENEYYIWDPTTGQYVPKQAPKALYNPVTGTWDTTEWVYAPELGTYVARPIVSASINQTGSGSNNGIVGPGGGSFGISNTGAGSTNGINSQGSFNALINLLFNGSVSNVLDSNSRSGDALVQGNTKAGDALTGDAAAVANVLNMLQSAWFGQGSNLGGFVANVDGDVVGDLIVDPSHIVYGNGLPPNANVDINVDSNGVIDNDINLVATSGNATLDSNSEAGNAETGDAHALANILNMINSGIVADHSFIGMLNIFGNLNGDIYLPAGVLDQALIASTGANSNNQISEECQNNNQEERILACNNLDVATDTNRTINNNITTDATSGNATLTGNTQAGSGQSGSANTNVNTADLVGQNVTGKNALLVFVNVMGRWMGFFYTPSGQAAITNTGSSSDNTITSNANRSVSVDANENSLINNDINVAAHSGDASVSNNTLAGNAKTGDATADVNIFNMIDSQINVDDFFGVLFINIFGDWFGSFGANTAAGNAPITSGVGGGSAAIGNTATNVSASSNPTPGTNPLIAAAYVFFNNRNQVSPDNTTVAVAGSSNSTPSATATAKPSSSVATAHTNSSMLQVILVSTLVLAALISGFMFLDHRYFIVDRLLA